MIRASKELLTMPLIECFILSSLLLRVIIPQLFLFPLLIILWFTGPWEMTHGVIAFTHWPTTEAIPVILCIAGLLSHFIFYSLLKKKYNFETNVFLYGVGFTFCFVTFLLLTLGMLYYPFVGLLKVSIEENLWYFYILPFTLLYYSYATLLQNKEKGIGGVTLFLTALTVISFAVLIIFEKMKYGVPYIGILPTIFTLYLAYCLIRKKGILNLQIFTWSPFIPLAIVYWYSVIKILMRGII